MCIWEKYDLADLSASSLLIICIHQLNDIYYQKSYIFCKNCKKKISEKIMISLDLAAAYPRGRGGGSRVLHVPDQHRADEAGAGVPRR